jgi:hypothetical protein
MVCPWAVSLRVRQQILVLHREGVLTTPVAGKIVRDCIPGYLGLDAAVPQSQRPIIRAVEGSDQHPNSLAARVAHEERRSANPTEPAFGCFR